MTASSQNPFGAQPPNPNPPHDPRPLQAAVASYATALPAPAGPAGAHAAQPQPDLRACVDCGSPRGPLVERLTPFGAAVWACLGGCTPQEAPAVRTYDARTVEDIAAEAGKQARAEVAAELTEAAHDRQTSEWFHDRCRAVARLCEDRNLDDRLTVGEVLAAVDGRAPTVLPLTVRWDDTVNGPAGDGPGATTLVGGITARGGKAVLVLDDEQRLALGGQLLATDRLTWACPTTGCGMTADELDGSGPPLFGWIRVRVAGVDGPPRWWCSPGCVHAALTAAAAVDPHAQAPAVPALATPAEAEAVDRSVEGAFPTVAAFLADERTREAADSVGEQTPEPPYVGDPLAYGPAGIRCGCGKDAHSNLVPCQPDSPGADRSAEVERWNEAHPVGTPVTAYPGVRGENALTTRTLSTAWLLGDHTPVVLVEGYAGGIALDHIDVAAHAEQDQAAAAEGTTGGGL